MATITKQAEQYLEALANALEIPPSRYEQAEKSYKSLGEWLHRKESAVRDYAPDVFVQCSFRLGTVIKPQSDEEEYDVDCACSLTTPGSAAKRVEAQKSPTQPSIFSRV